MIAPRAESEIQTVSISPQLPPRSDAAPSMEAPCLATPQRRLGAKSPFGLALPEARPSASTLYAPRGVWLDDQRLIVCDSGNHRILIWNSIPTADQAEADVVLCQPNFESEGANARGRGPENGLHLPTGVIVADGRLVAGDAWHHRVLVWNSVPTESDVPPDYAIGQANLFEIEANRGSRPSRHTMNWPYGVAWINGRFYVADTGNRRVLVWNGFPEPGQGADVVLGQPNESAREENRGGPVANDSFRWPHDFAGVGEALFVADAGNHRVLGWSRSPAHDCPADMVLGQRDETTAYELPYDAQGPRRLRFPYAVDACDDILAVADTANNRVLFWKTPLAEDAYALACDVIGQVDFASNGENRWRSVDADSLCWPYGISFHRGRMAVADSGNNRVTLWDCRPILERFSRK